jgi:hypothetical protein
MSTTTDPTTTEPQVEQVYEDTRSSGNELYQIVYLDGQIVLFRSEKEKSNGDNYHRMEKRSAFDGLVEAGRLKLRPDSDLDLICMDGIDWTDVSYIGKETAENLNKEGYRTVVDVRQADDAELLMIDGLGAGGLENLRDFAQ